MRTITHSDALRIDGEKLRLARLRRGMSREDLAVAAGCARSTVWRAHARLPITLVNARQIAKALRVSLKTICGGSIVDAMVTDASRQRDAGTSRSE